MAKKRRGNSAANIFGGRSVEQQDTSRTKSYTSKNYTSATDSKDNEEPIISEVEEGQTTETPNREELFKELDILNLSKNTVWVVVLATILNLYYVYSLRAQVLDELFDTNFSKDFIDTREFPRITNGLFLFSTGVFLILNYRLLQEIKYENRDNLNNREVGSAWRSFLSSLFTFLAVTISRNNLEL